MRQSKKNYRRVPRERQEGRPYMAIGLVLALTMLFAILAFSGGNDVDPASGQITDASTEETAEALRAYGRGVPEMEEINAMIDGTSTN